MRFRVLALLAVEVALMAGCGPGARLPNFSPRPQGTSAWGLAVINTAVDLQVLETAMGTPFAVLGDYMPLSGAPYPNPFAQTARKDGAFIYLNINSWQVVGGVKRCYSWADVASGKEDSLLLAWVSELKAFDYSNMFISFHHEPDINQPNEPACGSPQDYRAAYEHVYEYFRSHGIDYPFVWTATAGAYRNGVASQFQPSHFDYLGVDGYNTSTGADWKNFAQVFGAAHDYSLAGGKRLFIGEMGCVEDPGDAGRKARWIADAAHVIRQWGDVRAVLWDDNGAVRPDSSTTSLRAWAGASKSPFFGGAG